MKTLSGTRAGRRRRPQRLNDALLFLAAALGCFVTVRGESAPAVHAPALELLPAPRHIEVLESVFSPGEETTIWAPEIAQKEVRRSVDRLQQLLKKRGLATGTTTEWIPEKCTGSLKLRPDLVPQPDGYRIHISSNRLSISAHDAAGLHYAVLTLSQILEQIPIGKAIPCMKISDWPDFANRGIMLDVSRDKVPKMETLYTLVDHFSSWKINQLQLYTEHAFAYKGHEQVWKDVSPMTAEQVRALDAYCRERFIELVPNQNTFGHMNRWLKHEPYRQFAEAPDGYKVGDKIVSPTALCATDPRSISLIEDLLGQLIPNFTSNQINVGCDETHDLGKVRTKEICKTIGTGRVYLDFLLKIYAITEKHGKVMQFWGDIINYYPELIPELPANVIAMIWGYRPEHPYDKECRRFKASGVPFYVCPGTSSWLSLSGRTERGFINIRNAIENGKKYGATGVLTTCWGDRGYWQSYPNPFPAFVYSAGMSWCVDSNREAKVASLLNRYVYMDETQILGELVCEIGNAYSAAEGYYNGNTSYLARALLDPELSLTDNHFKWLTPAKVAKIRAHVNKTMLPIDDAKPRSNDASLVLAEIRHSAELVLLACDVLDARLAADEGELIKMPNKVREELSTRLRTAIEVHEKLWLQRNRIGGLSDSSARMDALLKLLDS